MSTFVYSIMLLMLLSLSWIVYNIKKAPVMDDNGFIVEDDDVEDNKEEKVPLWDDNKQHTENFF